MKFILQIYKRSHISSATYADSLMTSGDGFSESKVIIVKVYGTFDFTISKVCVVWKLEKKCMFWMCNISVDEQWKTNELREKFGIKVIWYSIQERRLS